MVFRLVHISSSELFKVGAQHERSGAQWKKAAALESAHGFLAALCCYLQAT